MSELKRGPGIHKEHAQEHDAHERAYRRWLEQEGRRAELATPDAASIPHERPDE